MGEDTDIARNEDELDPAQAAMVRKMRRLVGVSTSIMLIGFLAVMSVIVYRLVKQDATPSGAEAVRRVLETAPGARIVSASADGGRVYVTVAEADGAARIHVLDGETLATRGMIETAR
jgi:hypothetical protein